MRATTAFLLLALASGAASGLDLMSAWTLAQQNDAQLQVARHAAEAEREGIAISSAKLLPNVRYGGSVTTNVTEQTFLNQARPVLDTHYMASRHVVSASQPLLRMATFIERDQSKALAAAAEQALAQEQQMLAVRVAGAYFDLLFARDQLETTRRQGEFMRAALTQAEKALLHGAGTRTDIADARSRLDTAAADAIEREGQVAAAERGLAAIIGRAIPADALLPMMPSRFTAQVPEPRVVTDWVAAARAGNAEIASLKLGLEAAEREVDMRRAGHLPTIDLVASMSMSRNDGDINVGNQFRTTALGVQLAIPLYSGGGIDAAVRQSIASREKARAKLEAALRKLEVDVGKEFSAVGLGVARIGALAQAVRSAEEAAYASQKGVKAGTRNIVDALNAQQQVFNAQTALTRGRHDYAMALLRLKALAGKLGENDMRLANAWLGDP